MTGVHYAVFAKKDESAPNRLENRKMRVFNRRAKREAALKALEQDLQHLMDRGADFNITRKDEIFGIFFIECKENVAEKIKNLSSVHCVREDAQIPVKLLNNTL